MEEHTCACPHCDCKVPETAVPVGGKYYCSSACATAHDDRRPCQDPKCDCHKHGWGGIKT